MLWKDIENTGLFEKDNSWEQEDGILMIRPKKDLALNLWFIDRLFDHHPLVGFMMYEDESTFHVITGKDPEDTANHILHELGQDEDFELGVEIDDFWLIGLR